MNLPTSVVAYDMSDSGSVSVESFMVELKKSLVLINMDAYLFFNGNHVIKLAETLFASVDWEVDCGLNYLAESMKNMRLLH